jgi:bifunctional oligoribonuclease and PAP phosphatase NrnA
MLQEVLKSIDRHRDFVLTTHARPDGDAIGSALACCQLLRGMGKQAQVVLSDAVPFVYRSLPFTQEVVQRPSVDGSYDAAIILECDSVQRTHLLGLEDKFLINIDHHISGKPFADVNWIDPSACATAELIFQLSKEAGVPVTPEMATCLYTAVLTDTGSFAFSGTNERTFKLAQQLVVAGADAVRIAQMVYFSYPTSKMRLLGAALTNLQREGPLAWMWVTNEEMAASQAEEEDAEGLVNYALGIAGVEAAAFFRQLPEGRFRVSLRSKGRINVATIADEFGGGGHPCASGLSIDGPLDAAQERVLSCIRKVLLPR